MPEPVRLQHELDRLALSHSDLTLAVECSRYLKEHGLLGSATDGGNHLFAVALQHALIVSYCRPFTQRRDRKGRREEHDYLADYLRSFSAREKGLHHRLLSLRDQVVGHSDASRSEASIRVDRETPTPCTRGPVADR